LTPSTPTFANVMEKIRKAHTLSASVVITGNKTTEKHETKVSDKRGAGKETVEKTVGRVLDAKGTVYLRDDGSVRYHGRTEYEPTQLDREIQAELDRAVKKELGRAALALPSDLGSSAFPDMRENIFVYNAGTKKTILMFPKAKLFHELEVGCGAAGDEPPQDTRDLIEVLQALKQCGDMPKKELAEKTLNGKNVKGFLTNGPYGAQTVWIDKATGSVAAIEFEREGIKATISDIQIDPAIADSMFSTDKPAGYTTDPMCSFSMFGMGKPGSQEKVRMTDFNSESCVVKVLTEYTSASGGKYPDRLECIDGELAMLKAEKQAEKSGLLGARGVSGGGFCGGCFPQEWSYLGKGKAAGHKDEIIYWYKKPNGSYRALYGDLKFRDIKLEDLRARGLLARKTDYRNLPPVFFGMMEVGHGEAVITKTVVSEKVIETDEDKLIAAIEIYASFIADDGKTPRLPDQIENLQAELDKLAGTNEFCKKRVADAACVKEFSQDVAKFLKSLPKDGYAYLGKGKKSVQKDEIIFWYKKKDGKYRALYGNLVFKDIKPEDLPKRK
jgi:hypothetical protein